MRLLKLLRLPAILLAALFSGCHTIDDERIPRMPVNIDLSNQGVWSVYGVINYGEFNEFIIDRKLPPGFPYIYNSATGYGGVLLIGGQNPYTGDVGPLAYDLSCPVERMPDVRVYVNADFHAVCPQCGSIYNVTETGGIPIDGPAKEMGYAMTHYECLPTINGGYFITN